jgi:uncharacterized membrane protein YeaQ/YmgE (transglycosylase-associated protein family)
MSRRAGLYQEGDPVGFVMAVIGSIALLFLYRPLSADRRRSSYLTER